MLNADVADDTQATPPVLELSALPMMTLAKLVRQITLKLTCGEGPVGKLGQDDVQRLLGKLDVCDRALLSAYMSFEDHGDDRRLCADWRQLLREPSA